MSETLFCPSCGGALTKATTSTEMTCPHCGGAKDLQETAKQPKTRPGLVLVAALVIVAGGVGLAIMYWPENKSPVDLSTLAVNDPGLSVSEHDPPGKKVFLTKGCARCHSLTSGRKRGLGPSLEKTGGDPEHTPGWLAEQVRSPRSHDPNGRMPGYNESKISDLELASLVDYLASLK